MEVNGSLRIVLLNDVMFPSLLLNLLIPKQNASKINSRNRNTGSNTQYTLHQTQIVSSLGIVQLHHVIHSLVHLPDPQQLLLQKLRIRQQSHQHLVQQVVLLQQVLVRQLQLASLRQLLLPVHQHVLAQQILQHLVLLFQLLDRHVNRHQRRLQTLEELLFVIALLATLRHSPQQVLIAELVYFLEREGSFELLVYFHHFVLHLFLPGLEPLQVLFHLFVSVFSLLDLSLQRGLDVLLLLLHSLQLLTQLLELILEALEFFVLPSRQLLVELFDLLSGFFASISEHFPAYLNEGPPHILRPYLLHYLEHQFQPFVLPYCHSRISDPRKGIAHFSVENPYQRSQPVAVVIIQLVLPHLSHFSDLSQHFVQNTPFFANHEGSQQPYRSPSLLLQYLLSMQIVSLFRYQGNSTHILEGVPLFLILLTSKNSLNDFFHSLLNPQSPEGDEPGGLEPPMHAIIEYFGESEGEQSGGCLCVSERGGLFE